MAELKLKVTNTFRKNWNSNKRIVINRGGTRSAKTYSICQLAANWLATGQVRANKELKKGVWSIVRKYRATITRTVEKEFKDVCENIVLDGKPFFDYLKVNKSNKTYSFQGRSVCFIGADDEQKLRGYKSNILYCNEANELRFAKEFFQLLMRTTDEIFLDFNPSDEYIWINTELEQKRLPTKKDVEVIISTYKDNPTLNKEQVSEIENLKDTDIELWKVYGLGEYGKIQGLVFDRWEVCDKIPNRYKWKCLGLDFGFTNDPTALIEVVYCKGELWLNELIYEKRLTNSDIVSSMEKLKVSKSIEIIADSADPKSIFEIQKNGYNITGAKKGADSINFGLDAMKRYKINITATSQNLIKEFRTYKYVENKTSDKNKPIDFNNHAIDAARYAATYKILIPTQESHTETF
jgi:phage terminase large subunit